MPRVLTFFNQTFLNDNKIISALCETKPLESSRKIISTKVCTEKLSGQTLTLCKFFIANILSWNEPTSSDPI